MLQRKKIRLGCQKLTSTLGRRKEGEKKSKFGICLIIYVNVSLIFLQFYGNQEIDFLKMLRQPIPIFYLCNIEKVGGENPEQISAQF